MIKFTVCDRNKLLDSWAVVAGEVAKFATGEDYTVSDLRDSLARGDSTLLLMESGDGSLVGFAVVAIAVYPRKRYLRELHLWVLPEYRNGRVFSEYLDFVRAWSVEQGCSGNIISFPADDEPRWSKLMEHSGFTRHTVEYIWEAN